MYRAVVSLYSALLPSPPNFIIQQSGERNKPSWVCKEHNVSFCSLLLNFVEIQLTTHLLCVQYKLYSDCSIILRFKSAVIIQEQGCFTEMQISAQCNNGYPIGFHFLSVHINQFLSLFHSNITFISIHSDTININSINIVIGHSFGT